MTAFDLRPLNLGEILDRIRLALQHFLFVGLIRNPGAGFRHQPAAGAITPRRGLSRDWVSKRD